MPLIMSLEALRSNCCCSVFLSRGHFELFYAVRLCQLWKRETTTQNWGFGESPELPIACREYNVLILQELRTVSEGFGSRPAIQSGGIGSRPYLRNDSYFM